ncbi:hypothetical protein [Bdellovibrio sp. HCB274]|uniref:hypothetical protein n=1 Tax=Bdellovibrio sp. HCB274 TaxID=3394361 RepID=UPI0039B4A460
MDKKIVVLFLGLFFTSCATQPTSQQLMDADYGSAPSNEEKVVKDFMSTILKDPSSAQYKFSGRSNTAWARNGFGGYVGYQNHYFLIKNERVIYAPGPGYVSDRSCNPYGMSF